MRFLAIKNAFLTFRVTFIVVMSYFTLACQGQAEYTQPEIPVRYTAFSVNDTVLTQEELREIKSHYEAKFISSSEQGDNDSYWTPEALLPKISSWFKAERGLWKLESIGNEYLVYHLAVLPDELIQELDTVLLKDRYSLSILTSQFWSEIQKAQKQGVRIAFISSKSPSMASGFYMHSLSLIGLSLISEPGTLAHELRHHEQYKYVNLNYKPKYLNSSCLQKMSRAFGEVDATTSELHLYSGIENEFNELFSKTEFNFHSPQVQLLNINLGYPSMALQKIEVSTDCPAELKIPMKELSAYLADQGDRLKNWLMTIPGEIYQQRMVRQKQTVNQCETQSSPACDKLEQSFLLHQEKMESAKENFKIQLAQAVLNRPQIIKKTLSQLPQPLQKDLCYGANGLHFYLSCEK